MTGTTATVWIDSWQMQCCGESFALGDEVTWEVSASPDRAWLETVVGAETAEAITHTEDHHGLLEGEELELTGRVLSIGSASCDYTPSQTERRALVPVPGTALLRPIEVADGRDGDLKDRRFTGYVVELELED